jgi:hypothetical protein
MSIGQLNRIGVKLALDLPPDGSPDLAPLIPLFHDWIRGTSRPGLLLDVADYRHVPQGPGVMLIGQEGDWSLDLADGRAGMQYLRKTELSGDLAAKIRQILTLAADAAADLPWPVRGDDWTVFANDRLNAPNSAETRAALVEAAREVAREVAAEETSIDEIEGDPRARPAVRVRGGVSTAAALAQRLHDPPLSRPKPR